MESRRNSSGTSSQDLIRCSSVIKVKDLLSRLGETPENFTGRILSMSMFNDIYCGTRDNEQECLANARLVSLYARKFGKGQWSFIGRGSEKKWYSMKQDSPQGIEDNLAEKMLIEFAESGCPIFRATTPLSRGQFKSKGRGKLSIHFAADQDTIDTIFRIIISVNQLSIYGAVAALCEDFENHQDRSGEPEMMGQSIVLGEVKAEAPLHDENPMNDQIIWQRYIQQVESLSPENRVSKFCKEAGFMRVVEVGQYFVTKDTGNLRQFRSVACREYTLPRDDPASQPKGWIQGFQHFKYGIEIRIESVNQDNSHSWVRISYGTVKYVIDSIQDNTGIPADPQEEQIPQTSIKVVAARSKAKAKPQPRELVGTTATIPMHKRRWIDIEPSEQNLASYDLSKKVINLLRHNQTVQREKDGAIEFYKIKFHLRNHHSQIQNWSDDRWKACLAAGGGSKRRYQYCSDESGTILYLRALQGHSGNNLIDPTLQDNVVIVSGIFNYIYHIGCAFNLHSVINNGLIPGGQDLSRRQTVFFLPIDPRDTDHKDPEHIDFSVPRRARYVHSAWKRHQDAVFWVDIDLAIREGLTFYQTRSNAIILQGTLPAYCIPKFERLKPGEVLHERPYLSPRPPPKISLGHDHNWTRGNDQLGSTVEQQAQIYLKPPIIITMSNSWKASLQQATQSGMTTALGLLKSGKLRLRRTIDRCDLIELLGEWYLKVRPGHEEILLDGTAQSVRNEETPRDRSERPDIDSQEEARPQQFVIGNDEAELELSVESRSFVSRVNDQVQKRQKDFEWYRKWSL